MKVAFQIDQLWFSAPGGIGTYVWELFPALAGLDDAPELVPFRSKWGHHPARIWTTSLPPVESRLPIKMWYRAWDLLGGPSLPRQLASCGIVHATNHASVPPVHRGQKLVVTVHDLAFERFPEAFPATWLRLYRAGVRAAARRADAIMTPSRATADDLTARSDVDPSKVHVTPLASGLPSSPDDAAATLSRHGIEGPFILCAATIEPRKNQTRLVQAYRKIATHLPHTLVLAGPDGWLSRDLDAELSRIGSGRIVRTGRLEDLELDALYRAADLVAYPSLYEGFGLPVIEAMARGVPVVASTTPAVAETAGGAALLIDPLDVNALAAAMERVLTDPALAADLRARGFARASGFTWEATARATLDVYRRVTGAA